MVNDLLDLAKVEAGKIDIKPVPFTVADLFGGLRGALKPLLVSPSVELIFEAARELPGLYTDEAKLTQILRNLISNALKFTEQGEVRVTARSDDDGMMCFSVRDTGIGIAPEDQAAVFEEFRQVGRDYTRKQEGTGLGLALTKKFVELHGGKIWLESEPGKGSTFTFTVPLRQ